MLYEKIEGWVNGHKGEGKDKFGKLKLKFADRRHFLEGDEMAYCASAAVIEVV